MMNCWTCIRASCFDTEPAESGSPMADYDRHEWLAKRIEPAIDPTRQIIDAHHHLWDRNKSMYLVEQLHDDTSAGHQITHTVFVECSANYDQDAVAALAPVGETRFVADQAAQAKTRAGSAIGAIVSHADLTLGAAVGEVLAAHEEAGAGLFRGVRHGTNWSPHPDVKIGHHRPTQHLLADRSFRDGVAVLAEMGFSFDAWLYFDQLRELADLAHAMPECSIVLDHLGGPLGIGPHATQRDDMLAVWRSGLQAVAACPNVVLKVGGLGMEHYFGTDWAAQAVPPSSEQVAAHWHDMVRFAIDTFSPSRCMFESNFPVDRQTVPYTVLWNGFQILADTYSEAEQHELFFATAARSYAIDV